MIDLRLERDFCHCLEHKNISWNKNCQTKIETSRLSRCAFFVRGKMSNPLELSKFQNTQKQNHQLKVNINALTPISLYPLVNEVNINNE